MRFIQEQQEYEEPSDFLNDTLEALTRQWKNGTTPTVSYHAQMALIYSNKKMVEECRQHAELVPDDASATDRLNTYIALARMLVYEKNLPKAIEYYRKALEADAANSMALEEIGCCLYELQQFEDAAEYFELATIEEPHLSNLWEGRGMCAAQLEQYEEAIACFNKAVETDEQQYDLAHYQYYTGYCYEKMGDFYRALSYYTKSLDADPTLANSLNNMAALYFEHESDIKTAIKYLKQAETVAETNDDDQLLQLVCINLSRLYKMTLDYDNESHYKQKLFSLLGLGDVMNFDDDDEEEEE